MAEEEVTAVVAGKRQWYVQDWVFAGDDAPRVVFELCAWRNLEVADNAASRGDLRYCRGG